MTIGEVVRLLRAEGLNASAGVIHYAISTDRIDRPPFNGAKMMLFSEVHVAQARAYFEHPPRRGPKSKKQAATV